MASGDVIGHSNMKNVELIELTGERIVRYIHRFRQLFYVLVNDVKTYPLLYDRGKNLDLPYSASLPEQVMKCLIDSEIRLEGGNIKKVGFCSTKMAYAYLESEAIPDKFPVPGLHPELLFVISDTTGLLMKMGTWVPSIQEVLLIDSDCRHLVLSF